MTPIVWTRSTRCTSGGCVEVCFITAGDGVEVQMRSTEDPEVVVSFTERDWVVFVAGVKAGEFDVAGTGAAT